MAEAALGFILGQEVGGREVGRRAIPNWDPTVANVADTGLALSGLAAAARAGLEVPRHLVSSSLTALVECQAPRGVSTSLRIDRVLGQERTEWSLPARARGFGFAQSMSNEPKGQPTAYGALGLAICHDLLKGDRDYRPEAQTKAREALRDALGWMQSNFAVSRSPHDLDIYHLEWLQTMARLCIHQRIRFLGIHDWYREGAEVLLQKRTAAGSWGGWSQTSRALLFLMNAGVPSATPPILPPNDPPAAK
jgi:hypothetical protein